jgi:hypothetical protein
LATAGLIAAAPSGGAAPSCAGTITITCTFSFTGAADSFTVPAGVTQLTVEAFGAQGGAGVSTAGGEGGRTKAVLAVTPGAVLQVNVGGHGGDGSSVAGGTVGFNGGGAGGFATLAGTSGAGGGGGGSSDVRAGGTTLADRVVVAAGGGGTGDVSGLNAGAGGGTNGGDATGATFPFGGFGATQIAGGANGGAQGTGGAGSGTCIMPIPTVTICFAGGGGGGGLFGGGGAGALGFNVGGGGGSSSPTTDTSSGVRTGDGLITITYTPATPASGGPVFSGPANALNVAPRFTG